MILEALEEGRIPYLGPSRIPLPSVFALLGSGAWKRNAEPRDRSNDMTDDAIDQLL